MHSRLSSALVAFPLLLAAPPPLSAEDLHVGSGAIAASVRDAGGRPVSGALVVADGPALREATTGSAGVVVLQALPAGTYSLRVTRAGYAVFGTMVNVPPTGASPTLVRVGMATAAFADVKDVAATIDTPVAGTGGDPYVAHALAASPGIALVRSGAGAGLSASLQGAGPAESRFELDGIPIAGGPAGFAAVRFRNATALDTVEIVPGPAFDGPVRAAIGGIVNYRTPTIRSAPAGAAEFGYDSAFGSYEHVRYTQTYGNLGVLADTVTGGGENRYQNLKLRYALSNATSLGFASYASQSLASIGSVDVANVAPAYAADLRTGVGTGTFTARAFGSVSRTGAAPASSAAPLEDAFVRGVQLRYELPSGEHLLSVDFDRRTEATSLAAGGRLRETFTTFAPRLDLQLSRLTRLELGDAYAGGTSVRARNDPHVALAWRTSERLTVRLAAGSAYATAPQDTLAVARDVSALAAPETSFGYRLGADAVLGAGSRAWAAAFELRRFDTFGAFARARSSGIEAGYETTPVQKRRIGALASIDLVTSRSSGPSQPPERVVGSFCCAGGQLAGVPYTKARAALSYRADAADLQFGTTWLGANNALTGRGTVLGDASVAFPFAHLVRVRIGVENLFAAPVADPVLRPLFVPHELTLVVGPSIGP